MRLPKGFMTDESLLQPLSYIPANILCAQDYEWAARQFIASPSYAYIAGGSFRDYTLQSNTKAFESWSVIPRVLSSLSNAQTSISLLGKQRNHPILLAPVAFQQLAHQQAELDVARAAAATDTGMIVSTLSSYSLEDIATSDSGFKWFQLYFQPNEKISLDLVRRAEKSGYEAIVVTLDASIKVPSLSAQRAGFVMPPEMQAANFAAYPDVTADVQPQQSLFQVADANANHWAKLTWLLEQTQLPIIVKGVLHPDDAVKLKSMGIAGIVVSNHGGRGLDGAPASLDVLQSIRRVVGDTYPVLFDSGVRSGLDIFKAIALGADAVLIGRLQVYALSVAGALGVAHLMKLLRQELEVVMAMTGCNSVAEIRNASLLSISRAD